MNKTLLFRLFVLAAAMMCALGTNAAEAYACYTTSNTTLTFYYDNYRSSRTGTTYDLNTGATDTGWDTDGINVSVTKVVFDPSFAGARPTSTYDWFYEMWNLESITGMSYLNTSEVTNMGYMFPSCSKLTSLDLSSFNTSKVTDMRYMFYGCRNLRTIYVGSGWSTAAVTGSANMFYNCTSLVGGQGTTYDDNHIDKAYAHIDGGTSNPGYFTEWKEAYACYTPSNTTLTFYYDGKRSSRTGMTYSLNTGSTYPAWKTDGTNANVTKVVFNSSFADARPTTTGSWFQNMENLQSITGMSYLNTSEVTYMAYMFFNCSGLTGIDLSHFNTSRVTTMRTMFGSCQALESLDLSSFNTSQVTNMEYMFSNCTNLRTIYVGSGWSTAALTYSSNMFEGCTSLVGGQGTTWSSSNPKDKTYAHIDGGTSNPGYFTEWKEAYACYTPSNTTLTFYYDNQRSSRTGTTYDLNTGFTYPAWYTDGTIASVTKVVFDPSFAITRPNTTYGWFYSMQNLKSITGLSYLNTSDVTNMGYMFYGCSELTNLDLSNFNTSQVTYMGYMFFNCRNLQTIYVGDGWSTAAVTSSTYMFFGCTSLVGGQGTTWSSSNPKDKAYAHIDGGPSNPGYFTAEGQQPWTAPEPYACYTPENTTLTFYYDGLRSTRPGTTYDMNTGINFPDWQIDHTNGSVTHVVFDPSFANARPRTTSAWFYEMSKLKSITDLHYLNTDSVTYMGAMFSRCFALENVDLSNFNTDNVTSMTQMFFYCASLSSLDLGSFNTAKVANMNRMFYACQNLQTIYVGNGWSTDAVTTSIEMLNACTSLVGGMGTTYDESNPKDKTYAHIDGGPSNPGYFTDKNAGQRGDVDGDGDVSISDVSLLIDYLLSGSATDFNLAGADADQDGEVGIADASAIIDYLLSGNW